jgi:hypothetical protein
LQSRKDKWQCMIFPGKEISRQLPKGVPKLIDHCPYIYFCNLHALYRVLNTCQTIVSIFPYSLFLLAFFLQSKQNPPKNNLIWSHQILHILRSNITCIINGVGWEKKLLSILFYDLTWRVLKN